MNRLYSFEKWSIQEKRKSKPDYLDLDKDGDKKELMKKAAKEARGSKGKKSKGKGLTAAQKKLPKALQDSILKRMTESISLEYLEELYDKGAISSDVYDIIKLEDANKLERINNLGDERRIKLKVLDLLNDLGGISSDALDMERDSI